MDLELRVHKLIKGDCVLHYYTTDMREGKTNLVLLHGVGVDHHSFDVYFRQLSDRYNVLTMDLRGHGKSRPSDADPITLDLLTEDVEDVLVDAGWSSAVFIGQGIGSSIAQLLLYEKPDYVLGIGILSGSCDYAAVGIFSRGMMNVMNTIVSAYRYDKIRKNLSMSNSISKEGREYTHRCITKMLKKDLLGVMRAAGDPAGHGKDSVTQINGFAAVSQSEIGNGGKKLSEQFHRHMPNVDCYIIPRSAVLLQYDAAKQMAELTERLWLKLYDPEGYRQAIDAAQKEYKKQMEKLLEKQRKEAEKARGKSGKK